MTESTQQPISQERLREIYNKHGGDLTKVADELSIPWSDFVLIYGTSLAPQTSVAARRRQPPAALGQEKLRRHQISTRHKDNPYWPADHIGRIEDARAKYEAGTHEMCQGRDGDWFILYLIPRKKRCGARRFFQTHD